MVGAATLKILHFVADTTASGRRRLPSEGSPSLVRTDPQTLIKVRVLAKAEFATNWQLPGAGPLSLGQRFELRGCEIPLTRAHRR